MVFPLFLFNYQGFISLVSSLDTRALPIYVALTSANEPESRGTYFLNAHLPRKLCGDKMGNDDKSGSELDQFEARLNAARQNTDSAHVSKAKPTETPKGFGLAMRCGTDLIAGLAVGVAIGYALDTYVFDTKPWLMVLFFFLGAAAGMMNVFRTVQGLGMAVGYKDTPEQDEKTDNLKD